MRINAEHMKKGVTIEDANSTYIHDNVKIGVDTVIHPNTTIKEGVIIGSDCEIGPNAYIREGCIIGNDVKIGNCVEIKKTIIGNRTKVPHFIYLGDAQVGEDCNIGCGTITCNYDGKNKNKTIIGNRAFIGSNVNLVAPVTIGDDTLIAAGSTITDDVPSGKMGIARQRQINKDRKKAKVMKTSDLERELGLSKYTLRYYEKEGLITPQRDDNGYRCYSDEDLQTLKLVKFLRSLNISIDDVKAIIHGQLDFHECLKMNQIHLDHQIESLKEVKKTIDNYHDKDLPLIPALQDIQETTHHWKLGIQKTTNTVLVYIGNKIMNIVAKKNIQKI